MKKQAKNTQNKIKNILMILCVGLIIVSFSGCSNGGGDSSQGAENNDASDDTK